MRRRTDLKPNIRIRIIANGLTFYCRVKDLACDPVLACLAAFNDARAYNKGRTIGFASTFNGHNIQIDLATKPLKSRTSSPIYVE